MKNKAIFLLLVSVLVFFSRFYKLESIPPHLTIDEVSIGYNAYSILKTGKDEWGNFLPTSFRSVGDYKAPTLVYLTIPFIKIFGLNEMATRLPAAIFSAVSVYVFWLLVSRHVFRGKYSYLSYLATLIFTISPWLIPFYRSGFEAILALTFLLINILFAFEFKKDGKLTNFFLMVIFAYMAAITYHSTKIVVPLLNLFFIATNAGHVNNMARKWYQEKKIQLLIVSVLLTFATYFFASNYIFGSGSSRASMTLLTKDYDYNVALLPVFQKNPLSFITSGIGLVMFWFKRYLEYFSPNFHLSTGLGLATPGHPGQGVIYSIEYIFLGIGFILLIFGNKFFYSSDSKKIINQILFVWFAVSLLPASITNNSQHALRTITAVPVISILITLGIAYLFERAKNSLQKYLLFTVLIIGYTFGIVRFVDFFTLHYPVELSETRSYGWKQMAIYARDHHQEYDNVYVDPRFGSNGPYTYGVPYLYFLFYSQYDPLTYISHPQRQVPGQSFQNFENYHFINVDWPDFDHSKHNLYIASPWSFPKQIFNTEKQKYFVPFLNNSSGLYAISD